MSSDPHDQPGSGGVPPHEPLPIERQKGRPMWGCVRAIFILSCAVLLILFLSVWGGWWYVGTPNFAAFVKRKIEQNLQSHLGRTVTIQKVTVMRGKRPRIILDNLTIANVPGAAQPYFAQVRQVEITGGIDSFWQRVVRVGRIDVRDPKLNFEVFEAGAPLQHNFPKWTRSRPRRFQITKVEIDKMYVTGGAFEFLDHRHEIHALMTGLTSEVTPRFQKQIYEGIASSPSIDVRLKNYTPFQLTMRGGFHYEPGSLTLHSVALRGEGIETFLSGKIDPLTEAVYDFQLRSRLEMAKAREIFQIDRQLEGLVVLDTRLRGSKGDFTLAGDFSADAITADAYDLTDVRGTLDVNDERANVVVQSGQYGGGSISAQYALAKYAEPYPMTVHLDYNRVSIEKLFSDWDLEDTGLQGVATGSLDYAWNKDKILDGSGRGTAKFLPGTTAFGDAAYPIAFSGATDFDLERGVVRFRRLDLTTDRSQIALTGTLRIDDLRADMRANIRSEDFEELDKIAYNFAHAADKGDFELLGLGGSGTVTGSVRGPLKEPDVVAKVTSGNLEYNNILLGAADIDLRYQGRRNLLTFENAVFRKEGGTLTMKGDIVFPDRGPAPRFDLAIVTNDYDVKTALDVVELEFAVTGRGTGRLQVTGTPDSGRVVFNALHIQRDRAGLNLNGLIAWAPGEGNVSFDLDIGAESYPVEEIIAFLDLGDLPVKGNLTGTLHIEGPKNALEGAGSITIRDGSIFGEPVQLATADLLFTEGYVRATHVEVRADAGTIAGEAEYHFETERFRYTIRGEQVDISRIALFSALSKFFTGRLNITSTGSGTMEQPEVVFEATLAEGTIAGADFPDGTPPPSFKFSIRDGKMEIDGAAFDVVFIDGGGTVGPNSELDGTVQIRVTDVARFLQIFAPATGMPAAGKIVVDLRLGGKLTPTEAIIVEGTVPVLDLTVSGHPLTVEEPIHFGLRAGRIEFDSFRIRSDESVFSLAGFVSLTGDKTIDLDMRGLVEAALLQFFVADLKAEGHIDVAASITGTLDAPRINGTAEIREAQLKPPGFPQLIDDITGTLVFRGDSVEIDSLRATLGGGTVVAGGVIGIEGLSFRSARVNLQGTDVSIRYFEGVTIDGDFTLLLSGDAERMALQGDIYVDRALYYKDFDFATSLLNLLLERRAVVPEIAASWQDRVALRIHLVAPQTLAVKNNIADATGSADLEVSGTLGNPIILGLVTIDEGGTVRFQNVNYRIVRGTINFQNPFRIDPFFDITAEGRQQEYDLTINLTGTLDHITPTITSDPPMSDLTLLTLLSPGGFRGDQTTRGLQPQQLGTAGASLLVQSLGGWFGSKVFPFADSFRLDAGSLENLTSFAPTVTFEKQLSRDIRLIVVYNTLNQHNREIIEWQVTGDWVVQFTRDTARDDYAMDARFRRRYEGHW